MKKVFLSFILFLVMTAYGYAQKPGVLVMEFKNNSDASQSVVEQIRDAVAQCMTSSGRFKVVDVKSETAFSSEEDRRMAESAMSDETARKSIMGTIGCSYILTGNVTGLGTEWSSANSEYKGICNFSLSLLETSNGTTMGTEVISGTSYNKDSSAARNGALGDACGAGPINRFFDKYIKIGGKVLELDEVKDGKAKTLYINLGSSIGVKAGDICEVFKKKSVAGKVVKTKIGEVKVKEVQGEDISLCNVSKAGDEIYNAFSADPESLSIQTREKKAGLFGVNDIFK